VPRRAPRCRRWAWWRQALPPPARRPTRTEATFAPIAQTVDTVGDDLVADLQPVHDGSAHAIGSAGLDDANRDRIVRLDEIDEGAGLASGCRAGTTIASFTVSTSRRTLTN